MKFNFDQLIFVMTILAFVLLNKKMLGNKYNILNPHMILSIVWVIAYLTHGYIYADSMYQNFLFKVNLLGYICFSFGFWIFANKNVYVRHGEINYEYNCDFLIVLLKVTTICQTLRVMISVYDVYKITGSFFKILSLNTAVRNIYLQRDIGASTYVLSLPISMMVMVGYVVLGICMAKKTKHCFLYFLYWSITDLIASLETMSKLGFVLFLVVVGVTYIGNVEKLIAQKRILKKGLPIIIALILLFLIAIGLQRGYQTNGKIIDSVINKSLVYLASPMEAFGSIVYINDLNAAYVNVGDGLTNVFTWFRSFYRAGGIMGCGVMPFLLGIWAGIIYNPKLHVLYADIANSWTTAMLFMSFYSYLWTHKTYYFCIVLGVIIDVYFAKRLYNNSVETKKKGENYISN